ncbi:MAG: serine/threonine protein kinase [Acidobacteria bacterium]|nr:serine/threonine protein kinase [Acidobacteriota bacterium]MCI0621070.1 serine/threonine protein kinase [Acidobacteriota bacterium]MCI0718229.1 serine/threonine protein kinase [Acidobacteriota bacterium]
MEQLGRYKIQGVLGRGAMGIVFRAHDPKIDRVVAIKTITILGVAPDEEKEYRQRFFREARAAGKLSHPGLVTIYDVGEQEGTQAPYIVMEYIEGRTLESFISDSVGKSIQVSLDLVKQVAEALDYAHSKGIVHRDIKPANIIVTPDGRARITDFGIAKLAVTQLTMPGEALGTPAYMSPEQVTGDHLDGRSDLFSLGIILYSMLVGQKPFTGENATTVMFNITYKEPIPLTRLNPSLDPRFDGFIEHALAKRPADRYQSGREFADDLESLCQGRTLRSRINTRVEADPEKTVVQKPTQSLPTQSALEARLPASWVGRATALASQLFRKVRSVFEQIVRTDFTRRVSWKAQLGLAGVALFLALFVFGSIGPAKTAKLEIRCVHSFVAAGLLVWIDGKLAYETTLAGTVRKRLGLIKTVQGSFLDAVAIAPGKHVIRVQVISKPAGYDQTREVEAELVPESMKTLEIGFAGRSDDLDLTLR